MLGYNEMLRKIKPSAIICYGTPFDEMKGNVIAVDYAATNNLKPQKSYIVYKTYRYDNFENGMGGAGGSPTSNVSINSLTDSSPIRSVPISKLPDNVRRAYEGYNSVNWQGNFNGQSPGTRSGGKFNNDNSPLPERDGNNNQIHYREFDVNDKIPGQGRDSERFVVDDNGRIYYTPDHYDTFIEIIGD